MRTDEHDRTCDILGIRVKTLDWPEVLRDLEDALEPGRPQRLVNFLNANNANIAHGNQAYRRSLARSDVLPDGIGVDIASRLLHGRPFPANLNGTDLIPAFLVHVTRPLRVALIGAREEVIEAAVGNFAKATPWHAFRAISHGYFSPSETGAILADLAAFDPDVTLVALGSPAQEIWMDAHIGPGHGRLVFGVGALFDFVSGVVPRAPELVRNLRLEWVYRLMVEPGRLWRRYILGNPVFLYRVLRYKYSGSRLEPRAAR
jgi:bacterial polymer biosynthesis proteins, WecB/TagA/CpsF family